MDYIAKKVFLISILYIIFMGWVMLSANHLGPDTYYYWQWSRNLALSYYDGPPMIAYIFSISTFFLGHSHLALLLPGMICIAFTTYLLYQTCHLLFDDKKIAFYSSLIWLSTMGCIRHFFLLVTYDTCLICFWALTYYFFILLIQTNKNKYYYFLGVSIGLLLLSKYTGILLCASLAIFCLSYPEQRNYFKNKHFYLAILVAFIIFSPVSIWNLQHHWASFAYQLHHGFGQQHIGFNGIKTYLINNLIDYNIYFIILFFLLITNFKKIILNKSLFILLLPTLFPWLFFLYSSLRSIPETSWQAAFFYTSTILIAYFLQIKNIKAIIIYCFVFIASLFSLGYLINIRLPQWSITQGWNQVYATKQLTQTLPSQLYKNQILFSNDYYWLPSIFSFYAESHPKFFSTDINNGKQYYYWFEQYKPVKTGDSVLYLTYNKEFFSPYFRQCKLLAHETYLQKNYFGKNKNWNLFLFACQFE